MVNTVSIALFVCVLLIIGLVLLLLLESYASQSLSMTSLESFQNPMLTGSNVIINTCTNKQQLEQLKNNGEEKQISEENTLQMMMKENNYDPFSYIQADYWKQREIDLYSVNTNLAFDQIQSTYSKVSTFNTFTLLITFDNHQIVQHILQKKINFVLRIAFLYSENNQLKSDIITIETGLPETICVSLQPFQFVTELNTKIIKNKNILRPINISFHAVYQEENSITTTIHITSITLGNNTNNKQQFQALLPFYGILLQTTHHLYQLNQKVKHHFITTHSSFIPWNRHFVANFNSIMDKNNITFLQSSYFTIHFTLPNGKQWNDYFQLNESIRIVLASEFFSHNLFVDHQNEIVVNDFLRKQIESNSLPDSMRHFDNSISIIDCLFTADLLSSNLLSITTSLQFKSSFGNLFIIPFFAHSKFTSIPLVSIVIENEFQAKFIPVLKSSPITLKHRQFMKLNTFQQIADFYTIMNTQFHYSTSTATTFLIDKTKDNLSVYQTCNRVRNLIPQTNFSVPLFLEKKIQNIPQIIPFQTGITLAGVFYYNRTFFSMYNSTSPFICEEVFQLTSSSKASSLIHTLIFRVFVSGIEVLFDNIQLIKLDAITLVDNTPVLYSILMTLETISIAFVPYITNSYIQNKNLTISHSLHPQLKQMMISNQMKIQHVASKHSIMHNIIIKSSIPLFTIVNTVTDVSFTNILQELLVFVGSIQPITLHHISLVSSISSYQFIKTSITFSNINFFVDFDLRKFLQFAKQQTLGDKVFVYHIYNSEKTRGIALYLEILNNSESFHTEFALSFYFYCSVFESQTIQQHVRLIDMNSFLSTTEQTVRISFSNNFGKYTISNNITKESIKLDFFKCIATRPGVISTTNLLSHLFQYFIGATFTHCDVLTETQYGTCNLFTGYVPSTLLMHKNMNYVRQFDKTFIDITNIPDNYIMNKTSVITDETGNVTLL